MHACLWMTIPLSVCPLSQMDVNTEKRGSFSYNRSFVYWWEVKGNTWNNMGSSPSSLGCQVQGCHSLKGSPILENGHRHLSHHWRAQCPTSIMSFILLQDREYGGRLRGGVYYWLGTCVYFRPIHYMQDWLTDWYRACTTSGYNRRSTC